MDDRNRILEVEHLSMHFESKKRGKTSLVKAVDDVSFYVKRGETFGLVGESGCGKTTTGRTIIRLYDPTDGTIRFDGTDISGKIDKKLRKYITDNIAMIFQDPIASLNPRMTVQEIIAEGLKIRGVKDQRSCTAAWWRCWSMWGFRPSMPPAILMSFPAAKGSESALPGR